MDKRFMIDVVLTQTYPKDIDTIQKITKDKDNNIIVKTTRAHQRLLRMKNVAFQMMLEYKVNNKINELVYHRVKTKIRQLKEKGITLEGGKVVTLDKNKKEHKNILKDKITNIVENAKELDDSKQNDHLGTMHQ